MKKTLLMVAAALAASVISSQAQVYSQNIVGYANVSTPNGGTYLLSCPFQIGSSNGANEVWPLVGGNPSIPDFSTILLWTGSGYTGYQSDSTSSSLWDDSGGNPIAFAPKLPVGTGFFLIPSGNTTNTFAGAIQQLVGTLSTNHLANGGTYLVGPKVPYAGAATNGTGVVNYTGVSLDAPSGLPDFSTMLIWNGSGYTGYQSDSTSPSYWDDNGGNPIATAPTINVGQGFFLIPSGDFDWKQGL